jgi:3-(3-hydroxy-phenyl)propionate hydroxylase
MSTAASYPDSPLTTPDEDDFTGPMAPGSPCADAPVGLKRGQGWLLPQLGAGFVLLSFGAAAAPAVSVGGVQARVLGVGRELRDTDGVPARRYDARPGTVILIRPDRHVVARWRRWDATKIEAAMRRCLCL